jgi:acetyltransferase
VVFKLLSPDITHKSDVGGVELNIANSAEAAVAYQRIMSRARQHRPEARLDGVTVQPMVTLAHGYELIVGVKRDPVFGAVLMVGAGGVAAEINQDRALELPPLSDRLARRMLESLRSWPLLKGYRGKPAVNVERLIEVLMRLSYLVADHPEILELDINPLLAAPQDVIALDARIVLDRRGLGQARGPYAHLAIRPYPDEWTRDVTLRDGTQVCLRAIKPEDEPLWLAMLASCSPETLHQRFRYMFKATSHEMAARFCFLDYDREAAIVAEEEHADQRRLIGVGRLISNVDHQQAEYAVLVADQWQGRGLGGILTDYCLEIGKRWGLSRVVAEMAAENHRVTALFQRRGFAFRRVSDDTLQALKDL